MPEKDQIPEDELPEFTAQDIQQMDRLIFDELAGPYYLELKLPLIDFAVLRNMLQNRIQQFSDISRIIRFLKHMPESYSITLYEDLGLAPWQCSRILSRIVKELPSCSWEADQIDKKMSELIQSPGSPGEIVSAVTYIGLCGAAAPVGSIGQIAYLLGRTETIRRLRVGISKLG